MLIATSALDLGANKTMFCILVCILQHSTKHGKKFHHIFQNFTITVCTDATAIFNQHILKIELLYLSSDTQCTGISFSITIQIISHDDFLHRLQYSVDNIAYYGLILIT